MGRREGREGTPTEGGSREEGGGKVGDGEDWEVGDSLPGADEGGEWSGRVEYWAMWERREVSV